jgi:choice-of-anchor A domain-containing protein
MKKAIATLAVLAITALVGFPLHARADTILSFSVYASEAVTTTRVTTHGRVAIAGAPTFTNMVIGDTLSNSHGTRNDLIAGGALTYNSGTVNNGNVLYGAALTVANWTSTAGNGAAVLDPSYPFTPLTNQAASLSTYFAGLTPTASVTSGATLTLTGTNSSRDVFDLTGTQFDGAITAINIVNVNAGELIIVNVGGSGHTKSDLVITNVGTPGNTYFNFTSPAGLTFTRVNFPGTVLSPNAEITLTGVPTTGSTIQGSLWAKEITATDYTIGNAIQVPEPGTCLLVVSGLVCLFAVTFKKRPVPVA